ncbi:MAG: hypothetical protein E7218_00455 [Anaerofustis stercorihominis]|nr:hypothetical protein [Anaerofustis stercorihominis]
MIETKLRNAVEKLPQAKSTFYDVSQRAGSKRKLSNTGKRAALLAVVMILVCGVVFAGVTEADFGAWVTHSDSYTDAAKIADEIGITLPEHLGDSPFYNITTMYVVPDGTSYLEALTTPVYKWYSADFGIKTVEYDGDGRGYSPVVYDSITLSFGDTENEMWKYVFGANADGSWSSDDYDNVSMIEYEGITIQLSEKTLYSAEGDELSDIGYRIKWVDSRNNSVFVLHMSGSPYDGAEEIIGIANSIITVN